MRILRPLTTGRTRIALRRRIRPRPSRPPATVHVSAALREFVEELPHERKSILAFVSRAASALSPGTRVLDAGAGDAPYRELFAHCDYVTADWPNSVHSGGRSADILASLDDLPVPDGSFDAALSTQVIEHVAKPAQVLVELHRVIRPGGTLWLTAPLVWPLHEEPYDFFRYTNHGLRHLLGEAGFVEVDVRPRNGCLATLSQLASTCAHMLGLPDDEWREERQRVVDDLKRLAEQLGTLDHLDTKRILPLGYEAQARRDGPAATS